MKKVNKFLFYMFPVLGFLSSCAPVMTSALFENNPNPYIDDYTSFASIDSMTHWGVYNVHDPAGFRVGDIFYAYSTDAIFHPSREEAMKAFQHPQGNIQVRKSKDLVHWEFVGWAFPEIPHEAVEWVRSNNSGRGATNIWAPFPVKYKEKYRLYYCVSAFGKSISYLGLAESDSPEGPWELKGAVVKTDSNSVMNAIDPSVVTNEKGEMWLYYGSYFGGLFAVQLNVETGLPLTENDQGQLVARRDNPERDNLEAPEIFYHPKFKKYYLLVSYDPLMTTYNVRASRSDSIDGVFSDYFGEDLRQKRKIYPILTFPYRFENHVGWAGTAHCGILERDGQYFLLHQGRLAPSFQMMDLHVREIFWTQDGWPCVSPERYAEIEQIPVSNHDMVGSWEVIIIRDHPDNPRQTEAGQIRWGEGNLLRGEMNVSERYILNKDKTISGKDGGSWNFNKNTKVLSLKIAENEYSELFVHWGQDWENECKTIMFTGLDKNGFSVWGKRVQE
jgi:arabinan endo-1,5-alpha-L-arabinosidase